MWVAIKYWAGARERSPVEIVSLYGYSSTVWILVAVSLTEGLQPLGTQHELNAVGGFAVARAHPCFATPNGDRLRRHSPLAHLPRPKPVPNPLHGAQRFRSPARHRRGRLPPRFRGRALVRVHGRRDGRSGRQGT